ncbi:MAG: septum formation initiator family protein [Hyphomicrobiaceae bacterium]|nr:septum formation initiator family protein [Hyphomicrobiaceae bacterium]
MVPRRRSPVLLVCLCLTAYFGYHAVKGKHGLEARSRLVSRSVQLERELAGLVAVRSRLEREVALLAEASPDPDYVDELARSMLRYVGPDEMIILEHPRQPPRR